MAALMSFQRRQWVRSRWCFWWIGLALSLSLSLSLSLFARLKLGPEMVWSENMNGNDFMVKGEKHFSWLNLRVQPNTQVLRKSISGSNLKPKQNKNKKFDDAFNSGPIPNKTLNRDRDPFPLTFLRGWQQSIEQARERERKKNKKKDQKEREREEKEIVKRTRERERQRRSGWSFNNGHKVL